MTHNRRNVPLALSFLRTGFSDRPKAGKYPGVWRILGTVTYIKRSYNQIPAGPRSSSPVCCFPIPTLHLPSFLRAREVSTPLGVNHPLWLGPPASCFPWFSTVSSLASPSFLVPSGFLKPVWSPLKEKFLLIKQYMDSIIHLLISNKHLLKFRYVPGLGIQT